MKSIKILCCLFMFTLSLMAQFNETIPTDHWIYKSINKLQVAGYFRSLSQGAKPYSRYQVAKTLYKYIKNNPKNEMVKIELDRLESEFEYEIRYFENEKNSKDDRSLFKLGIRLKNDIEYKDKFKDYFFSRLEGVANFNNNFTMKYSAYLDNSLSDDPYYTGYEWRGLVGVQEQVYMSYSNSNVEMKFGRDYVKWGYGKGGNVFISDNSRPFDMVSLKVKLKYIKFQTFLSQLDKMYDAERYLTAIRFEINPFKNLFIGVGQSAIYGGINRPVDFTISNPLFFYSFTQDNDNKPMNMMLYSDFAYYLRDKYKLYGELLIDDFQVDHEEKGDLEPNELAFLFGIEGIDLIFGINGWCEFTQVRNRTYNVPDSRPFEKFLHRNMYIGHPIGNDFQILQIESEKWIDSHFRISVGYKLIKKGEGTIRGDFTEPWTEDDITMETGYDEKIPFGIVETTNRIYSTLHYEYNDHIHSDLQLGYEHINNLNNQNNLTDSGFFVGMKLWFDGRIRF